MDQGTALLLRTDQNRSATSVGLRQEWVYSYCEFPSVECVIITATDKSFPSILWLASLAISIYFVRKTMKTHENIWAKTQRPIAAGDSSLETGKDNAWSADTHDLDDHPTGGVTYDSGNPQRDPFHDSHEHEHDMNNPYDPHPRHGREDPFDDSRTERGGRQEEDEYALLHGTETDDGRHPGRPVSWGSAGEPHGAAYGGRRYDDEDEADAGYQGRAHEQFAGQNYHPNANALSPGGYDDFRRGDYGYRGASDRS
jgi:hypothetical protein